ncbi:hypothetical protein K492DRAFT_173245 [Lichtheimia hyalospora FSU 10163]|nr:hypothetical protein K492DRAFT_173245 [Lichtheimia hyalospora FSU 10163]
MKLLLFLAVLTFVYTFSSALPIDESTASRPAAGGYRVDFYHIHHADNSDNGNSDASASSNTLVQVDRFAQLIATHWQFDHLDTIKSACYDYIAQQMRDHIEISVHGNNNNNDDPTLIATVPDQHPLSASSMSSSDVMDLDILRAQIFGAIQAHVGGRLPIMWDELGDKLGRPAIELYVRRLVLSHCRVSDDDDHVEHACLVEYGHQILAEIDRYVVRHLVNLFDIMNGEYLEPLLQHTATDLHQVLAYFNTALFSHETTRLSLQVLPWKQAEQRTHLYDFAASASNSPDHASDIIGYYANLARI